MRALAARLIPVLALIALGCARSGELRPFTTDRCSLAPDGPWIGSGPDWAACCIAHDRAYWQGGTREERRAADTAFRGCLDAARTRLAPVMELAVRVFGTPYLPTGFRWSYGWPYTHGYRPLTPAELQRAHELLPPRGDPAAEPGPVRPDAHEGAS